MHHIPRAAATAAAVVCLTAATAAAQVPAPTRGALEVATATAEAGDEIAVRGRGCAGSADVAFAVQGTAAGGTTADDGGGFTGVVPIPDEPSGDVELTATCPTAAGDTLALAATIVVGGSAPLDDSDTSLFVWAGLATLVVATAAVVRVRRRAHDPA
jgi:hypothetical protein